MPTSGPIVRTGTTPEFWKNWDQIFGNGSQSESSESGEKKRATKAAKKKSAASAKKKAKAPAKKK